MLNSFLDKNDAPRETLVLEYSFGRKSSQKQGMEKTLCHIWEYGGKLETLNSVLASIPVRGKFFFCIMIDLSKIKTVWETMETCVQTMNDIYSSSESMPELIIIGGKYDNFKNYGELMKSLICVFSCVDLHSSWVAEFKTLLLLGFINNELQIEIKLGR